MCTTCPGPPLRPADKDEIIAALNRTLSTALDSIDRTQITLNTALESIGPLQVAVAEIAPLQATVLQIETTVTNQTRAIADQTSAIAVLEASNNGPVVCVGQWGTVNSKAQLPGLANRRCTTFGSNDRPGGVSISDGPGWVATGDLPMLAEAFQDCRHIIGNLVINGIRLTSLGDSEHSLFANLETITGYLYILNNPVMRTIGTAFGSLRTIATRISGQNPGLIIISNAMLESSRSTLNSNSAQVAFRNLTSIGPGSANNNQVAIHWRNHGVLSGGRDQGATFCANVGPVLCPIADYAAWCSRRSDSAHDCCQEYCIGRTGETACRASLRTADSVGYWGNSRC